MSQVSLLEFAALCARHRKIPVDPARIVMALDPGETTGYALFQGTELKAFDQLATKPVEAGVDLIDTHIKSSAPHFLVYESYRVYSWKAQDHSWSEMHTSQLIGGMKYIASRYNLPTIPQTAQVAKQFVTDEKLKRWDMYARGQRHARDAIRHGAWFILFGEEKWLKEQKL